LGVVGLVLGSMDKLHVLFGGYPGGFAQLSEDTGVHVKSLYALSRGHRSKVPYEVLVSCVDVFDTMGYGGGVTLVEMIRMFEDARCELLERLV
jgi:hypothetical protein